MIFVFGSFPFSVLSLVHVLLKLLYVSVSRGRLCYRTELFYFNYLSCWASNTLYFLFSAATKKKRLPAASAHFTLFCFSQFQKIIFSRFCTVANYVIAPNYMLFILDFCYLAVGRIFLQEKTSWYFCLFYFSGILMIVFCRADLS